MNHQGQLLPDAGGYVRYVHSESSSRLFLARNAKQLDTGERLFFQIPMNLDASADKANSWQYYEEDDCYLGMNGFTWNGKRCVSDVLQLTSFYVDFDFYNIPEYSHLAPVDLAELIIKENPWMPEPSAVIDSGRGLWMVWLFKKPPRVKTKANHQWIPAWQEAQDFLIESLRKYGADSSCRDASRLVRMPETINSKTGRTAHCWQTGNKYEFNNLKKIILDQKRSVWEQKAALKPKPRKKKTASVSNLNAKVKNPYTLHWTRMRDYRVLAEMRGGHLYEHRRRALWFYAVSAAWFCNDEKSLREEVEKFCLKYIGNPSKYLTFNYKSTVTRFRAHRELKDQGYSLDEIWEMLGRGSKDLYKLYTSTIIRDLNITEAEQRKMAISIGPKEYKQREAKRSAKNRRKNGCKTRDEYNDQRKRAIAEKASEALRLRLAGVSVPTIALQMGCAERTVQRWFKKA